MSRELATTGNRAVATDDYFEQLAAIAGGLKGGGGGKAFMKFDGNTGEYSYGADDEALEIGAELAVNMRSAEWGWVIWVDGDVLHEEMVPMTTRQPAKHNLPDHGPYGEDDGPSEQYTIDMKMLDEPGVEMVFQANNNSKRRAMAALMKDFAASFRMHPGEVPIIELGEREFETTTKGKGKGRKIIKHAPSFKIVAWISEEELLAMSEGAPEDYPDDDKPAGKQRALPAPVEEAERPPRRSARAAPPEDEPAPPRTSRRTATPEPEPEDEPAPPRTSRRQREPEPEPEEAPRSARRQAARAPAPEPEEDTPPARTSRRQREPEPDDEGEEQPAERPASSSRRQREPEPAPASRGRGRY